MTRITEVFRGILASWNRYAVPQFTTPLTVPMFHDGR
jgi:hypothetical protein